MHLMQSNSMSHHLTTMVIHQPRGSSTDKRGGGIAIVHRDSIKVRPFDVGTPTEFEVQALKLMLRPSQQVIIACIYRPPGSVSQQFCTQLADMLDQLVLSGQRFVVCGNFNCPGTGGNPLDANRADVLQCYSLTQHVSGATHVDSNTLDLLLTSTSEVSLLSHVTVRPTCFSDHHSISCRLRMNHDPPTVVHYQFRDTRNIDMAEFHADIRCSPLYVFDQATSVDKYVELFDCELKRILDIHAPLQSRTRRVGRNDCRWLSDEARKAKRSCRRLERRYRRTKSSTDRLSLNAARTVAR